MQKQPSLVIKMLFKNISIIFVEIPLSPCIVETKRHPENQQTTKNYPTNYSLNFFRTFSKHSMYACSTYYDPLCKKRHKEND